MSVTAIRNPLKESEAQLFYCSGSRNLAMEHRHLTTSTATKYIDNKGEGDIINPADFSAVVWDDSVVVFGIIKVGEGKKAIAQVSPTVNPITGISPAIDPGKYTAIAATSDNAEEAWVYFLKDDTGAPDKPKIWEYNFKFGSEAGQRVLDGSQTLSGSSLVSWYDRSVPTRYVIFQNTSGGLSWVDVHDEDLRKIPNTQGAAMMKTPMALTVVDNGKNDLDVYLYFVGPGGTLKKTMKFGSAADDDEEAGNWTTPIDVPRVPKVENGSGLAAVADQTNNYIFYKKQGALTFDKYTDKLGPVPESETES